MVHLLKRRHSWSSARVPRDQLCFLSPVGFKQWLLWGQRGDHDWAPLSLSLHLVEKDMKQLSERKKRVTSDDLITILVSTRTEKKNALLSECMLERALTSLSDKISSRMWLLRKILKDKFKNGLQGTRCLRSMLYMLGTAFLKVLRQKRILAHSIKCGWESPACWTSGNKGKLCERRGFPCSSIGKESTCHWNMYITICEIDHQSKFSAWNRALKVSVLGQPGGRGDRWDGGHMYNPWLIHVNVWQKPPQYCEVISLQLN